MIACQILEKFEIYRLSAFSNYHLTRLMLGAIIRELRIACTIAQMEREGGISPRMSPLAQVRFLYDLKFTPNEMLLLRLFMASRFLESQSDISLMRYTMQPFIAAGLHLTYTLLLSLDLFVSIPSDGELVTLGSTFLGP